MLTPWEKKAHAEIRRVCFTAWRASQGKGKGKGRRHKPYHVPAYAAALVEALGLHDETAREHEIKRLFEVDRLGAYSLI